MKLLSALLVFSVATAVHAQRRVAGAPPEKTVALTIALKAGSKVYNFNGEGKCTYGLASIYAMRAERWTAERTGESPSAKLTVWKPAVGSDMLTLAFTIGDTRYSLNTVKVGGKGTPEGSGTVGIAREGAGGTFTISGTAGDGTPISGTVKCGAFSRPNEEGGL